MKTQLATLERSLVTAEVRLEAEHKSRAEREQDHARIVEAKCKQLTDTRGRPLNAEAELGHCSRPLNFQMTDVVAKLVDFEQQLDCLCRKHKADSQVMHDELVTKLDTLEKEMDFLSRTQKVEVQGTQAASQQESGPGPIAETSEPGAGERFAEKLALLEEEAGSGWSRSWSFI